MAGTTFSLSEFRRQNSGAILAEDSEKIAAYNSRVAEVEARSRARKARARRSKLPDEPFELFPKASEDLICHEKESQFSTLLKVSVSLICKLLDNCPCHKLKQFLWIVCATLCPTFLCF